MVAAIRPRWAPKATAALAHALSGSVAAVTGDAPVFEMCPDLLETRFYAERGVPLLAYGAGILAESHGPREFVKISRMAECAKIYALTAARMLGGDLVSRPHGS